MQKQKLARVLKVFSDFTVNERKVFMFLSEHHVFIGGYSDLCRALNLEPKKQASNIRKACLSLQQKNLIYIDNNGMFLTPDWDYILLSMTR